MSGPIDASDPSAPDASVSSPSTSLSTSGAPGGARSARTDAVAAPAVTLIVPIFNERRRIRGCLASILGQDIAPDRVEILLLDGGSTDGTPEIVREIMAAHPDAPLHLIDNEKRIPAAALNQGIRRARGAYILRLDAHCEAAPDFIRKTLEVLERTGAACVGGSVTSVGEGRAARAIALAMGSPFGVGNAHFRYGREERDVDAVAYGAYRREIFDEIGLYDEDLEYSEDNELNDRLTRTGRRVVLSPEIRVRYFTRETLGAFWRQYFRYGYGRTRYAMRAPGSLRPRHVAPFAFLGLMGVLLLAGFLDARFWLALAGVLGLWTLAAVAATVRIGIARGGDALPLVPFAFACQHFGYGLGQWAGLFSARRPRRDPKPAS